MTIEIDNAGVATFPDQEEVDSVDWKILADLGRRGISSGCAVTAQGSPNNTVAVAAGTVVYDGVEAAVTSGNVTMTAANATNPRFDFITVNNSGTKAYTAGTASANPVFPAIPANSVVLAAIYVPANDNVINTSQIKDRRVYTSSPDAASGWITLSKAGDESRATTTTFADDATLKFTMAASTKYRIRGEVFYNAPATPDFKFTFSGPASPTLLVVHYETLNASSGLVATAGYDLAYGTSHTSLAAGAEAHLRFAGICHNAGNVSPSFAFQWAQNVSDAAATIVRAGSRMEYKVA